MAAILSARASNLLEPTAIAAATARALATGKALEQVALAGYSDRRRAEPARIWRV